MDVRAGRRHRQRRIQATNTCHFTFVALKDGNATAVPRLVCRTREDKERYLRARMRRDLGLRYREEREGLAGQYDDLDDAAIDALMAEAAEDKATAG